MSMQVHFPVIYRQPRKPGLFVCLQEAVLPTVDPVDAPVAAIAPNNYGYEDTEFRWHDGKLWKPLLLQTPAVRKHQEITRHSFLPFETPQIVDRIEPVADQIRNLLRLFQAMPDERLADRSKGWKVDPDAVGTTGRYGLRVGDCLSRLAFIGDTLHVQSRGPSMWVLLETQKQVRGSYLEGRNFEYVSGQTWSAHFRADQVELARDMVARKGYDLEMSDEFKPRILIPEAMTYNFVPGRVEAAAWDALRHAELAKVSETDSEQVGVYLAVRRAFAAKYGASSSGAPGADFWPHHPFDLCADLELDMALAELAETYFDRPLHYRQRFGLDLIFAMARQQATLTESLLPEDADILDSLAP